MSDFTDPITNNNRIVASKVDGKTMPIHFRNHLEEDVLFPSNDFNLTLLRQHFQHLRHDTIPLHWHKELQAVWVHEGTLAFTVNEETFPLSDDTLLLINRGQLHRSRTIAGDAAAICINFEPDFFHPKVLQDYILPLLEKEAFSYRLLALSPEMTARLHRILAASDRSIPYFSVINLLSDCLEEIMQSSSGSGKTADFEDRNLFHRLLAYVEAHYQSPITVADLANHALINKNRCTALFQKYTQTSPMKYVAKHRLFLAKNLIIGTDLSISEISEAVGYNQTSYFVEQFRRSYGLPPLKYRKQFGDSSKV